MDVSPLSNFLRKHGFTGVPAPIAPMSPTPIHCRPARPDEVEPALRLILGTGGRLADNQQLLDFVQFANARRIDLNSTCIAEGAGNMIWAVLPIPSAGRTALLLAPNDVPQGTAQSAASMLLAMMCRQCAERDIQLAQALLEPADDIGRRLFEANGFERMAELLYLHTAIRKSHPPIALPPDISIMHYSPQTHHLFAEGIAASYRDSLDCPRLNGVRTMDDVIAGHKAGGEFVPENWHVICQHRAGEEKSKAVGVLLLTKLPRGDSAELVYLGLAPEARGKRLGEWMMRRAFAVASSMGAARLSLAVDAGNSPALKLYYRFGMSRLGSKVAMMKKLM